MRYLLHTGERGMQRNVRQLGRNTSHPRLDTGGSNREQGQPRFVIDPSWTFASARSPSTSRLI